MLLVLAVRLKLLLTSPHVPGQSVLSANSPVQIFPPPVPGCPPTMNPPDVYLYFCFNNISHQKCLLALSKDLSQEASYVFTKPLSLTPGKFDWTTSYK